MKKASRKPSKVPEMRPDYDFSKGVRGKFAKRFAEGSNVIVLSTDVAKVFRDSAAVNEALRTLMRLQAKAK